MQDVFTDRDPHYMCTGKHRGQLPEYAQWSIEKVEEAELFYTSVDSVWRIGEDDRWGILPDAKELGSRGEIISKFPKPANDDDPWHGYPASPRNKKGDRPPREIVDKWYAEDSIIGKPMRLAILRQQV